MRRRSAEERRARRRARWERPAPRRDWTWFVAGLGRILIVTGLLIFGFVAYQLWGTGLQYAQSQHRLDDELATLLAAADVAPPATTPTDGTASGPANAAESGGGPGASGASGLPTFEDGDALGRIEIPRIGVDAVVVAGVSVEDLRAGPGHYPTTPMPGQLGNSAIAGHRTTYGQPFYSLEQLQPGDQIVVTTVQGRFVYAVTASEVVAPDRGDVVATTDPTVARLTLTTCDPRWTATNRLIVYAELDPGASPEAQPPVIRGADTATPATLPGAATEDTTAGSVPPSAAGGEQASDGVDAFDQGWFHDTGAWPHVVAWGAAAGAVWLGAYLLARRAQRTWVGAAVGAVPFLVALYFFYENVNRLLPAAL